MAPFDCTESSNRSFIMCSFIEKSASTEPVKFRGTPPEKTKDNDKLYIGGCDCGAVQIALQTQPLSDVEIKEDNCSICIRV